MIEDVIEGRTWLTINFEDKNQVRRASDTKR